MISFTTLLAQPYLFPYLTAKELTHWVLMIRIIKYIIVKNFSEHDFSNLDKCCVLFNAVHSELFGKALTPLSIHIVLHARSNFQKHGPAVTYWCFPFERENEYIGIVMTTILSNTFQEISHQTASLDKLSKQF